MKHLAMNHLAELIRLGLSTANVREGHGVWGVFRNGDDTPAFANCWGLALVGKVGLRKALFLSRAGLEEIMQVGQRGKACQEIQDELGVSVDITDAITQRHAELSAETIAHEIENGTFLIPQ